MFWSICVKWGVAGLYYSAYFHTLSEILDRNVIILLSLKATLADLTSGVASGFGFFSPSFYQNAYKLCKDKLQLDIISKKIYQKGMTKESFQVNLRISGLSFDIIKVKKKYKKVFLVLFSLTAEYQLTDLFKKYNIRAFAFNKL